MDDLVGISLLTASAYSQEKQKYLLITSSLYKAQKVFSFLKTILPKAKISMFMNDELIRAENLSLSKEMAANRIYTLNEIVKGKNEIVVANIAAVLRYLPSVELFKKSSLSFKVGQEIDLQETKKALVKSGYYQVNKIDQSLQFASRGDILDIYSVNYDDAIRIELFGDEIESIRFFDIATQTSKEVINKVEILPANDFLFSEEEIKSAPEKLFKELEKDKNRLHPTDFESLRNVTESDMQDILECNYSPNLYRYFSFISDNCASLVDYCKDYNVVLVDENALSESSQMMIEESSSFLYELFEGGKAISGLSLFNDYSRLHFNRSTLIRTSLLQVDPNDIVFNCKSVPFESNKDVDVINIIRTYTNQNYKVNISLSSKDQLENIIDVLNSENIPFEMTDTLSLPSKRQVGISISSLPLGFVLDDEKIVYLTSKELFNHKVRVTRFDNRFKEATILRSGEDLTPGDYVVHEYQGIGEFVELQTLEVQGKHQDYLKIAYYGGEILYVPLNQLSLIRKYLGKEGVRPRLSRLHTKDWEKTKEKIKKRIHDLAERLFNLYV